MWYGKPRISRNSGRALGRLLRFRPVSVYVLLWKAKWSKENGFGRIPQPSTISGKNNSKVLSQWVFRLKFLIFIIIILAVFNKYSLDDLFLSLSHFHNFSRGKRPKRSAVMPIANMFTSQQEEVGEAPYCLSKTSPHVWVPFEHSFFSSKYIQKCESSHLIWRIMASFCSRMLP